MGEKFEFVNYFQRTMQIQYTTTSGAEKLQDNTKNLCTNISNKITDAHRCPDKTG